ncbi:MAG: hypothetical protein WA639_00535 [Candidatus Acidiferrum sp.]
MPPSRAVIIVNCKRSSLLFAVIFCLALGVMLMLVIFAPELAR